MLSHNSGGGPAYVAWWIVTLDSTGGFYCGGPRRQWFNCTPGWGSAGCMEPGSTYYSSTHTEDCDGNAVPNSLGQYGETSCCEDVNIGGCMGDPTMLGNGICNNGIPYQFGVVNYNPLATFDDGSCQPITYGCGDVNAINYNSSTCIDDNASCIYVGCADSNATNSSTNNIGCNMDPSDTSCCLYEGCNNQSATNYDPIATGCNNPPDVNDTSCCIYTATQDCDEVAWKNHVMATYPTLAADPQTAMVHFCEFCSDGTIDPLQESWCKCCPPSLPDPDPCDGYNAGSQQQQQSCCTKCSTSNNILPPSDPCWSFTNKCRCCPGLGPSNPVAPRLSDEEPSLDKDYPSIGNNLQEMLKRRAGIIK
jgi:hypothetical protein